MIDKIEFTSKNLTSNAGVLLLLNYTEEQRIFQELGEMLVFKNKSTDSHFASEFSFYHSINILKLLIFLTAKV